MMYMTVPVTVATAERSFSKLKLIKTSLRSSMTQERLRSLALLLIEKKIFFFGLFLQSGVATAYHFSPNRPVFNVRFLAKSGKVVQQTPRS